MLTPPHIHIPLLHVFDNTSRYGCHKDYYGGHNKYHYDTVLAYPLCWGSSCGYFSGTLTANSWKFSATYDLS